MEPHRGPPPCEADSDGRCLPLRSSLGKYGGCGEDFVLGGFDVTVPNPARMWNYWLGGKDNISQVVSQSPYSDRTAIIHARHASYSNIAPFAVR